MENLDHNLEYISELERFIALSEKEPDPEIMMADPSGICEVLGICEFSVEFFERADKSPEGNNGRLVFYSNNKPKGELIKVNKVTGGNNIAEYSAYHDATGPAWDDITRDRVRLLMSTAFVFNGRVRLLRVADKYMNFDPIGLHNVNYYTANLGRTMGAGRINDYIASFFNLRKFSIVNDAVGRDCGTRIMLEYAQRIQALKDDPFETVCRVGGDNFVVLLKKEKLDAFMDIINGQFMPYGKNEGDVIFVSASAGILRIDKYDDIRSPSNIMDRISMSATTSRRGGEGNIVFYSDIMKERREHSVKISNMFPAALEKEEFLVYYQPKIALDGYHIAGAEALCRWKHEGKIVPPGDFIPLLEQSLDICKLDFYMLDKVCRDIRRWLDMGKRVVKISVNLSRKHLTDVNLLKHILEIIDRNGVDHKYIELELTETTIDVEFDKLRDLVSNLQKNNISASVDDFGVGFSSLSLIKDIKWNVLKIDKSFLPEDDEPVQSSRYIMFHHVVSLAQELGLECVAEGVETKKQIEILRENCCNIAQGFFFDRPLPVEEFEQRLDNYVYSVNKQ